MDRYGYEVCYFSEIYCQVKWRVFQEFLTITGLRQGDPLTPYLFLFCFEGFWALLKNAQEENKLKGVSFGCTGPNVTHLLFADDSIVFLEASQSSFEELKNILNLYEEDYGQKVNLNKSSIFFGKGCQDNAKEVLKNVIGVQSEALSEHYLGLPTVGVDQKMELSKM